MRCEQVLLVLNFLSSETWKFSSGKRRLNRMHLFFSFFLFSAQEVRGYSSLSSYCDVTYHKSAYDVWRIQTLELWVSCFFLFFVFFFLFLTSKCLLVFNKAVYPTTYLQIYKISTFFLNERAKPIWFIQSDCQLRSEWGLL